MKKVSTAPTGSAKLHSGHCERPHKIAFTVVTALAFFTRFWGLSHPSDVVFDEAHTIRFTSWYLTRSYYFDLNPPFGKLCYAFLGWLFGFHGGFVPYDVGQSYITNDVPYVAMRAMPALLSTLTVSVVYLIMWESQYGLPACLVAAGLVLFDNAHIAQTRLIYIDAIMVFTTACSLYCYVKFSKLKSQAFSKQWWIWLFLTGVAMSCAISTKYIGLFAFITVGAAVMNDLWELFNIESYRVVSILEFAKHVIARVFALAIVPFMLYLLVFYVHFAILNRTGDGDEYMSLEFQATLSGNAAAQQGVKTMSFFRKWFELQRLMFYYNSTHGEGLPTHPYESRPYQWPFCSNGVSFWQSDEARQQIYFIGNVAGWWITTTLCAVFACIFVLDRIHLGRGINILHHQARSRLFKSTGFFFSAWATHYFSFYFMSRSLMLHTYLPAHVASTLVTGSLIEFFFDRQLFPSEPVAQVPSEKPTAGAAIQPTSIPAPTSRRAQTRFWGSSKAAWIACGVILGATFAFWCFWFPLTYGYPGLSINGVLRRQILGHRLHYAYDYELYAQFALDHPEYARNYGVYLEYAEQYAKYAS